MMGNMIGTNEKYTRSQKSARQDWALLARDIYPKQQGSQAGHHFTSLFFGNMISTDEKYIRSQKSPWQDWRLG